MKLSLKIKHAIQPRLTKLILRWMSAWETSVLNSPGSIKGVEKSPQRFNIIGEGLKLKDDHPPIPGFPRSVPFITSSILNIRKSVLELKKNPTHGQKRIDAATLNGLIAFAKTVKVDEIGFAEVPQEWVFKGMAVQFKHAIVLVMEMDKARMDTAPSPDTAVMVHETYNALGRASNKIADWLRERGFSTHAGHPLNGMALYPPIAQKAGLGCRGINGLLITPRFGPRVRLAAVFTDIQNLPVYQGSEHEWVLDYCHICRKCLQKCPPRAIYETPIYHDNQLVTTVDNTKCFPYFAIYHGCSICIKVCPFNQADYKKLKELLAHMTSNEPFKHSMKQRTIA